VVVVDQAVVDRDAEAAAQLRDRGVAGGEGVDGVADGRDGGQLEELLVAGESLAKHREVEDANVHDVDACSGSVRAAMASRGSGDRDHVRALYARIYQVVRKIPRGHVATYGQIAELAGIPGGGRVAGAAMKTSKKADKLPWQRVIGKASGRRGRIALHDPVGAAVQRGLLEDEGVDVGDRGLVDLGKYGWLPGARARRRR
jgi:methylated-DNA-protein-cysteine methyltransferase related protein